MHLQNATKVRAPSESVVHESGVEMRLGGSAKQSRQGNESEHRASDQSTLMSVCSENMGRDRYKTLTFWAAPWLSTPSGLMIVAQGYASRQRSPRKRQYSVLKELFNSVPRSWSHSRQAVRVHTYIPGHKARSPRRHSCVLMVRNGLTSTSCLDRRFVLVGSAAAA